MHDTQRQNEAEPEIETVRVHGHVKWFDGAKGYGFLVPNPGNTGGIVEDVMLHISALRRYGESIADEGANIICDAIRGERGWQVAEIVEMDKPKSVAALEDGRGAGL